MALTHLFEHVTKQSPSGYISVLRNDGYTQINKADNSFAVCMTKPDADHVVAVNFDASWAPLFYHYCQSNPDNPFLPTVHEIRMHDDFCVVRMEKLIAVDHHDVAPADKKLLQDNMESWVAFIRAEKGAVIDQEKNGYTLSETVRDILGLTQHLFKKTDGFTLPYCDVKPDNVFLRHTADGPQFVFGDPVFPGDGYNKDNLLFMNDVYRAFKLPAVTMGKQASRNLALA